jgi:GxxExxY protein
MTEKLIFKDEVYMIVGAAMEVYNQLGPGFLEAVYQEALEIELGLRDIPFASQPRLDITYKNQVLNSHYIPDLIIYEKIVVEIKAVSELTNRESAQLLNELKASDLPLGLLINFSNPIKLEWKRIVLTQKKNFVSISANSR